MLLKKILLKKAMESNEPKQKVKDLFLDFDAAYKRLRHPSKDHEKQYMDMYFKYDAYMKTKQNA